MSDVTICAFTQRPIPSARREFGLDLSEEAVRGPALDVYPFGARVVRVEHVETMRSSDVVYRYRLEIQGDWAPQLKAVFAAEGFRDKLAKLFKKEVQVGDSVFDDAVFIDAADAPALRALLAIEGVQSAILDLVGRAAVRTEPFTRDMVWEVGASGDAVTTSSFTFQINGFNIPIPGTGTKGEHRFTDTIISLDGDTLRYALDAEAFVDAQELLVPLLAIAYHLTHLEIA